MRRGTVVLFLVALLAACGSSGRTIVDKVPPASSTTTTVPPRSLPSRPGGVMRLEPTHNGAGVHTLKFDSTLAGATDDAVLIRFYAGIAPCFVLDSYRVSSKQATVTVTLYAGYDRSQPHAVCAAIALPYEVRVPIGAPLGSRQLVDGATATG